MGGPRRALSRALQRLGAKRVEAELVSFLAARDPADTKRIVEDTGLRQPEVSVGMRALRERGWVEVEPVPRSQKGRPLNRYHLAVDRQDILDHYDQQAQSLIQDVEEAKAAIHGALSR